MLRKEKSKVSFITAIITAAMLFSGLTLTGCASQNVEKPKQETGQTQQQPSTETEKTEKQQPVESQKGSGIVETNLNLVEQGKTLRLDFSLKNCVDQELELLFGSGHQYDIIVIDVQGREVYNWAADKDFTMALIDKTLAPDEKLSFSEEWNYTDTEGKPLPAGKYSVKVTIIASIENEALKDKVKAEDFTAVKEIEIK